MLLLILAALLLATPASAKYVTVGDVVWSTTLDGLTIDKLYPVGAIYMSVTDHGDDGPNEVFGGTWVRGRGACAPGRG